VTLHPYWSAFGMTGPPAFNGVVIPVDHPATVPTSPNRTPTNMASITDGTSNTFLVGETDFMPRGVPSTMMGGVWSYGYIGFSWGSTFHPLNKHNHTGTPYGAFRSQHSAGVNFAFADGSVRFVRESIANLTYQTLATRAGGEVVTND
jgi:prepilin-type processing-associated H-X9-DG protein